MVVAKRGLWLIGSTVAVVGAIGVFPASSRAGDNDNCCTSLEDSITKLEEQTKKHDSSKVSVTVSGWVTKSATGWSDGSDEHHSATPKE
jgi:hypothetical protein